jgi:uncharacterized protein
MTDRVWTGRRIVGGRASGTALVSLSPMSFLGDIDIRTGRVVEECSDIFGLSIAGRILVIPQSRGSAGAWRFLYQLHQHGTHPVALLTEGVPDPSVVQGAIMCGIPVVAGVARALSAADVNNRTLSVSEGTVRLDG